MPLGMFNTLKKDDQAYNTQGKARNNVSLCSVGSNTFLENGHHFLMLIPMTAGDRFLHVLLGITGQGHSHYELLIPSYYEIHNGGGERWFTSKHLRNGRSEIYQNQAKITPSTKSVEEMEEMDTTPQNIQVLHGFQVF